MIFDADRRAHAVFRLRNAAGEHFSRPLGGSVELGERSRDAAVREIHEELGATLVDPVLLGVVENVFELDGALGHEIDFVYVGDLAEPDVVPPEGRAFLDVDEPGWVEWRPVRDPDPSVALYPTGLQEMIEGWLDQPRVGGHLRS